jgi:DNA replication protein DnaC
MSNEILNNLLKEYEQKRIKAELDLEDRKNSLYASIPRLKEIEDELNNYAINTAKNLLKNNDNSLENLNLKIDLLKTERNEILKNNNLSENYLKPIYECNICKDTGYVLQNNYKTQICNCLKQKLLNISYNKSNISNLDKENFNTFNENIFSDDVDLSRYKLNISPRKNIINIKQKCIEFVNNFENLDQKNLLFTGNTGLGKTFMSNCIANELLKKRKNSIISNSTSIIRYNNR